MIVETIKIIFIDLKTITVIKKAHYFISVNKEITMPFSVRIWPISLEKRAAHFLKITPLRKCIAAVVACQVWIQPTLKSSSGTYEYATYLQAN